MSMKLIPKFARLRKTGEKVEVVGAGHFPDSVMVRMGDGCVVEIEMAGLKGERMDAAVESDE